MRLIRELFLKEMDCMQVAVAGGHNKKIINSPLDVKMRIL